MGVDPISQRSLSCAAPEVGTLERLRKCQSRSPLLCLCIHTGSIFLLRRAPTLPTRAAPAGAPFLLGDHITDLGAELKQPALSDDAGGWRLVR